MEQIQLTGDERVLLRSEIISTRTDEHGLITYANPKFMTVTGYTREEILGRPHNIIRHPDVPRAVYKVLWEVIQEREQFFGVTKNLCKNGDHYWTLGYFQPEMNTDGVILGYRSTRQGLHDNSLKAEFEELYQTVRQTELKQPRSLQVNAGMDCLMRQLKKRGYLDYQSFARRAL